MRDEAADIGVGVYGAGCVTIGSYDGLREDVGDEGCCCCGGCGS